MMSVVKNHRYVNVFQIRLSYQLVNTYICRYLPNSIKNVAVKSSIKYVFFLEIQKNATLWVALARFEPGLSDSKASVMTTQPRHTSLNEAKKPYT